MKKWSWFTNPKLLAFRKSGNLFDVDFPHIQELGHPGDLASCKQIAKGKLYILLTSHRKHQLQSANFRMPTFPLPPTGKSKGHRELQIPDTHADSEMSGIEYKLRKVFRNHDGGFCLTQYENTMTIHILQKDNGGGKLETPDRRWAQGLSGAETSASINHIAKETDSFGPYNCVGELSSMMWGYRLREEKSDRAQHAPWEEWPWAFVGSRDASVAESTFPCLSIAVHDDTNRLVFLDLVSLPKDTRFVPWDRCMERKTSYL
ncbi:hypothetical protein EDD18DRAFT_1109618 [Armillaria luteobubalina]|uniref:Uncharacterized protein n=1 Tax=Armillaria luteobubalina TaxID=153913 RepID=A0AA39PTU5_9AGAR|nr:hypothetical protein EDD18DRAFT_1109618 [Armillaria luteobubalina]